jgi:hypothetical protein
LYSSKSIVCFAAAIITLAECVSATAAMVALQTDTVTVDSWELPRTVGLEVYIGAGTTYVGNISAFQLRARFDPLSSNAAIVSAGQPLVHSYLGPSAQPAVSIVDNRVDAGDISLTGAVPLVLGAGLLRVGVTIPAGTPPGQYALTIESAPQFTFLADGNGMPIPLAAFSGSVQIINPGDYDRNLRVDHADIITWRSAFGNSANPSGSGADGNRDGRVDAADYVVWRKQLMQLSADYDLDGIVDAADDVVWRKTDGTPARYNPWLAQFGETTVGGTWAAHAAVPEPTSALLLLVELLAMASRRGAIEL